MTFEEPAVATGQPIMPGEVTMLTADIVRAYVGRNEMRIDELPLLINEVHGALIGLNSEQAPAEPPRPEPAVSPRASVKPDQVTCMDCGFRGKLLKRHLRNEHNLTPEAYRARWGLSADHPLVAPNYAERRRDLAKQIGLGRHPQAGRRHKVDGAG